MTDKPVGTCEIQWGPCCFCGALIAATEVDPCRVTVETAAERWQVWFCHSDCFRHRLIDHPEIDLSPAIF
jgi:hypothetical protein